MAVLLLVAVLPISFASCGDDDDDNPIVNPTNPEDNSVDVAVTGSVSELKALYAVITGVVNVEQITASYNSIEFGVEISTSQDFYNAQRFSATGLVGKTFSVRVTGLTAKTKYYYRTYVDISSLTFAYYGSSASFTTLDISSSGGTENGHQYVDLGLPSGTKWADRNIGASSSSGYGDYFAWGETTTKSNYDWSTYKYGNAYNKLTKYCTNSSYGKDGFTDNKTELVLDDDVAHKEWGGSWRMPSKEQIEELINNTTSEFTTVNNVKGYLFTASNGNSIFLPAAGFRGGTSLGYAGSGGGYWSRTLNADHPNGAYYLYFYSDEVYVYDYYYGYLDRYYGRTVRPVRS